MVYAETGNPTMLKDNQNLVHIVPFVPLLLIEKALLEGESEIVTMLADIGPKNVQDNTLKRHINDKPTAYGK